MLTVLTVIFLGPAPVLPVAPARFPHGRWAQFVGRKSNMRLPSTLLGSAVDIFADAVCGALAGELSGGLRIVLVLPLLATFETYAAIAGIAARAGALRNCAAWGEDATINLNEVKINK